MNSALAGAPTITPFHDAIADSPSQEVAFSPPDPAEDFRGCCGAPEGIKVTFKLMLSNAEMGVAAKAVTMGERALSSLQSD